MTNAIWRRLEYVEKNAKVGSGKWSCFVVLGAHARVLNPIIVCHFNANSAPTICINIKDVYYRKNETFFNMHVKMEFVLTPTVSFNIWTLYDFEGIPFIHAPNARWLVCNGLHILT